jgi:tetratricopeptide (TPR) repeat protein
VGVLVLLAGMGRTAAGQPTRGEAVQTATAGPPRDGEAARLHYEKATAAYALGNFSEAASSYERAFELKPDPALLFNAAQAHRRGGNRPRAMQLYRSYLQVFPRADNRDLAERHLRDLERTADAPPSPPALALATPPPAAELATRQPPPSTPTPPPLWKRPWVWVATGAALVVATSATALALSRKIEPQPSWGRIGP